MKAKYQFTMQLANGREQTFESAADMVAWMDRQRGLGYSGKRRRRKKPKRNRVAAKLAEKNSAQETSAPLARYANRNSGEA